MGPGQDHRRRPRAAARARFQRLSALRPTRRVEVDAERLPGWVDRFTRRHGDIVAGPVADGLVLTARDGATAWLQPPWSYPDDTPDGLVDHVLRARTVALLLVRRGGYAVAVAEGTGLVDSKVGRRHVQGRTKAGGWSQQRYARRRKAQADEAFGAAADVAARILLPRLDGLDGLVTGGDRAAVRAVLDDPRLSRLTDLPRGRFLAVPDPRQRVLEDAVRRARAVTIDVYDPHLD